MNKSVHVFRSSKRVESSNLDNSDKVDTFQVELEDWLLENLNESFVCTEKLVRPTAKGIFVYLYLWFFRQQRQGSLEGLHRTLRPRRPERRVEVVDTPIPAFAFELSDSTCTGTRRSRYTDIPAKPT